MKSKKILALAILLMFLHVRTLAQNVGINDDGSIPDNSAMLHIKSANKGLLIPQIALTGVNDVTSIPSPATSLLVYNTTIGSGLTAGYYYNSGTPTAPVWTALTTISGLNNFTESNYLYNTKYGVKLLARNDAQTNVDFVLSPKGSGAILAQQPDGTATGGDNRGSSAIDWQLSRGLSSQVASGSYSVIAGGYYNEASKNHATVGGGSNNTAFGSYSCIPGGKSNSANEFASVAFGANNEANGMFSTASGYYNSAEGGNSFAAGLHNFANDYMEAVFGQYANMSYGSTSSWVTTDRLFTVGNGTGASGDLRKNALTILKNANTTIGGSLTINGNGTGTSLTLPVTRGTNGNVLTTDGIGGTTWTASSGGTVTGVTGTAPIVSSGGATPAISISAATTSAAGSMSAADKTKLDAITGTNTGNQTITLTGDVTGSGTGSFAATISSASVTNARMANMAANTIKVNNTASAAAPADLALSANTFPSRKSTGNITANSITDFAFDILNDDNAATVRTTIGAGTGNGTVTSVTGTAPISVTTGTITPAISISAATISAAGSMSAADKTKLDGSTHAIGDSYGGGIVFYVYDGGRHGLIAATTDQSNDIRWYGGTNTNTRARADGIGAGLKNTAIIIANQGPVDGNAFAATLCNEYSVTVNGVTYGDWYLPSKYELNLLYLQKDLVGNFTTGTYWSSTEFSATQVWVHVFFNGEQYEGGKSNIISTRAIRAF